jgi:predicted amidohydrolase
MPPERKRPSTIRAAAVQLTATADLEHNRRNAEDLIRTAAKQGAELVVLPEKWQVLGNDGATAAAAEPLDGGTIGWTLELAAELEIDLVAGSVIEAAAAGERTFNTSVHLTPQGELRAAYRKLHMFDVEVDGEFYRESAREQPGEDIVLTELSDGAQLGLSICYDLRFPELYRALSARGAEILTVPAAFTLATTRDHWEVLLRARAIENQCFVVAANQIGTHADGRRTGGRSMIVDPWGLVLACAPDREGVIVADLDLGRQARIRRELPALSHRRPELFSHGASYSSR